MCWRYCVFSFLPLHFVCNLLHQKHSIYRHLLLFIFPCCCFVVPTCSKCGKTFSRPSFLKEHLATHLTPESSSTNTFKCPYGGCIRSYTAKRNLNAHIRSCHEGQKFKCTFEGCSSALATKVCTCIMQI